MSNRLVNLREALEKLGIDACIISSTKNVLYLSGFTGTSACLYVDSQEAILITDFRYIGQAKEEVRGFEVLEHDAGFLPLIRSLIKERIRNVGFESSDSHEFYLSLKKVLRDDISLQAIDDVLEDLRMIKDEEEIAWIEEAAAIADQGFTFLLDNIKVGRTELDLALELEYFMKKKGAQGCSFNTIIASGKRSSLPHGVASDRIIQDNELILMDFGCVYKGYCSDMTRTVAVGDVSDAEKDLYQLVGRAQQAALDAVVEGTRASQIDLTGRDMITEAGYGEYFGHALGHGVGLDIHEKPSISYNDQTVLKENMVITIEPGIYLPEAFGVRIEDLVRVCKDGYELLSHSDKSLIIL